jgi:hypothetical protein
MVKKKIPRNCRLLDISQKAVENECPAALKILKSQIENI